MISKINTTFVTGERARRLSYTFPLKEDTNIGFTNLKIEGNLTDTEIDMIEFEIGGTRILRSAEKYDGYVSFTLLNDNILPAVKKHDFRLYMDLNPNKEVKISYDIVEISNPVDKWETIINQIQCTGSEHLITGHNKQRLNFNHPVEKIVIKSDEPISNVFITFDGKHTIPLQKIDSQYYECIFDNTINFSKVIDAFIEFDCFKSDDTKDYYVYAHSFNVLKGMDEMIGLAYSS